MQLLSLSSTGESMLLIDRSIMRESPRDEVDPRKKSCEHKSKPRGQNRIAQIVEKVPGGSSLVSFDQYRCVNAKDYSSRPVLYRNRRESAATSSCSQLSNVDRGPIPPLNLEKTQRASLAWASTTGFIRPPINYHVREQLTGMALYLEAMDNKSLCQIWTGLAQGWKSDAAVLQQYYQMQINTKNSLIAASNANTAPGHDMLGSELGRSSGNTAVMVTDLMWFSDKHDLEADAQAESILSTRYVITEDCRHHSNSNTESHARNFDSIEMPRPMVTTKTGDGHSSVLLPHVLNRDRGTCSEPNVIHLASQQEHNFLRFCSPPVVWSHLRNVGDFFLSQTKSRSDAWRHYKSIVIFDIPIELTLTEVTTQITVGPIASAHLYQSTSMRVWPPYKGNMALIIFVDPQAAANFVEECRIARSLDSRLGRVVPIPSMTHPCLSDALTSPYYQGLFRLLRESSRSESRIKDRSPHMITRTISVKTSATSPVGKSLLQGIIARIFIYWREAQNFPLASPLQIISKGRREVILEFQSIHQAIRARFALSMDEKLQNLNFSSSFDRDPL